MIVTNQAVSSRQVAMDEVFQFQVTHTRRYLGGDIHQYHLIDVTPDSN